SIRRRGLDQLVVVIVIGEGPVLYLIHRRAADFGRATLADDRDGAFPIARIGEDVDLDDADRAAAELQDGDTGIFGFDTTRLRRRFRDDTLDGTDQPLDEIDVVRGLVHERAAVELPRPAPRSGVVVFLWAVPAHGGVCEKD